MTARRLTFSERIGITEPPTNIQLNEMDDALRNSLWNLLYIFFHTDGCHRWEQLLTMLYLDYFKLPCTDIPSEGYRCMLHLKTTFYEATWYEVYNLIECVMANHEYAKEYLDVSEFEVYLNEFLAKELSGYQSINRVLVQITNPVEIEAIKRVIEGPSYVKGPAEHIKTALAFLAKKPDPDYRNSIRESISAVESITKYLVPSKANNFSAALKEMVKLFGIHGALARGFDNLYGYTSNKDGIRHAMLDEPTGIGPAEARFMLVACSAFVNYAIVKADEAGRLSK